MASASWLRKERRWGWPCHPVALCKGPRNTCSQRVLVSSVRMLSAHKHRELSSLSFQERAVKGMAPQEV